MPLVNWSDATPADLAGFTVDYLREELARRNLDATGSKEEIISRLIADIAQNRPTTPPLPSPDSAASTQRCNAAPLPPSLNAAQTTELLTGLLQQLLHVSQRAAAPVQVTTLPDLSASLPTYSGDGSISASHWVEELERTRNLASFPSGGNELSQPPVSPGPAFLPPAVPLSRPHRQRRPPERLKDYSLSQ
ncbi:hypothetical protein HPB49_005046 [Dermacentor silvarum]|uniref:Uncharacterized protein n=1 Tax=Dermacentor silvarum TaxID=543639 RepID=A0ACB8CPY7_DERSI|nr:hypothetical protein HPB49_005046 [Dermacentor silvarum]